MPQVWASRLAAEVRATRARIAAGLAVLEAMPPINHPGHADQKSHGRRHGAGGVRDSLAAAKTADEVGTVLASELSTLTGRDVAVDLKGMDVGLAREHAEGLLRGAEAFPDNELGRVSTFGPDGALPMREFGPFASELHAVTRPGADGARADMIAFNVSEEPATQRANLRRPGSVATTPTAAAIHEFGHVVTGHDDSIPGINKTVKASAEKAGEDFFIHIAKGVSPYAASSEYELAAEVFTDVMVNGSGATALSREAFTHIEQARGAGGPGAWLASQPEARTYKRDDHGRFSSTGGGATGQDALDAVPAKLVPGEQGHFGHYEGEELTGPPGMGSVRALSEYEGVEYDDTNNYLRRGPLAERLADAGVSADSMEAARGQDTEAAARIAEIDKTMAVSRLTDAVQVERGVGRGQHVFGDAWHEGVINKGTRDFDEQDREYDRWVAGERPDLTGMRFRDKGYTSTSADPRVAEQFVARRAKFQQEHMDFEGEPVVMRIQVPAGTGAVQMGTMAGPGEKLGRQHSAEILLDRGLTFEVTDDHGIDDQGIRRLDVTVVPDE